LVFNNGRTYGTKNYGINRNCGGPYLGKSGNKYYAKYCSRRVVIRQTALIHTLAVNNKVVAKYPKYRGKKDDPWFAGTVTGINLHTGRVSIKYGDGDKTNDAKPEEILYAPKRPNDWGKGKKRGNHLIPAGAKAVDLV